MSERIELFVPGRLCLFGEHSDWAGAYRNLNPSIVPGRAIVVGTNQGIYASACKNERFTVRFSYKQNESFSVEMNQAFLEEQAEEGGFYSYVCGVAAYMMEHYLVGGIQLEITKMDLPMKRGLSSSASICVLVAKAFNELYKLGMSTRELMNAAYEGEQKTPSRCGRLDQACIYGNIPVSMTFSENDLGISKISVGSPFYYVVADLMTGKDTVRILKDLNSAFPLPKTETEMGLHQALGKDNADIIKRAVQFLNDGNAKKLGALMTEAQRLFDEKVAPMSKEALAAPVLHSVMNNPIIQNLTYGAKGVGSQGDGSIQLLAKNEENQVKLVEYLAQELHMEAYPLTIMPNETVRKAIIPVAGFGTRMYPETRFIKKELCPVVDVDGMVKPALLILLEELDRAGLEEICLIINPEEQELYSSLFRPVSASHYEKLPTSMQKYEDRIQRVFAKVKFICQNEQRGFGHAVLQASEFVGNDPVLLLLGDTIYESTSDISCVSQLMNKYNTLGKTIVSVQSVPVADSQNYGMFSGEWKDINHSIFICKNVYEKPTPDYAANNLFMLSSQEEKIYYAAFGAYILKKEVFDRLRFATENNIVNEKGEVELTGALAYISEMNNLFCFVPDGKSYDLGNAEAYRKTVAEFGKCFDK